MRSLACFCVMLAACAAPPGPVVSAPGPAPAMPPAAMPSAPARAMPPGAPAPAVAPASASASPAIAGTRWTATGGGASAPRLEFVREGRVTGYTGCNMLSGEWRMEGNEIRFASIATTKRMCLGPEGEVEKRVLAAMGDQARARREGAKLVLESPAGARFEFGEAK